MLETAQNLEQAAKSFNPLVLTVPSLLALSFGLIIWLGGLGLRRFLVALVAAVVTYTSGSFVIGCDVISSAVFAVLVAAIAAVLERIFIVIIAAALAAAIGFAILAKPYFQEPAVVIIQQEPTEPFSMKQTVDILEAYMADFIGQAKYIGSQMPLYNWAILAGLCVIFIIGGFIFWNSVSALCCATLGAMFIFAGMILLLLYKAAEPIKRISDECSFYTSVFMAMVLSGTALQLLLFQQGIKKPAAKEGDGADSQPAKEPRMGWRNR